ASFPAFPRRASRGAKDGKSGAKGIRRGSPSYGLFLILGTRLADTSFNTMRRPTPRTKAGLSVMRGECDEQAPRPQARKENPRPGREKSPGRTPGAAQAAPPGAGGSARLRVAVRSDGPVTVCGDRGIRQPLFTGVPAMKKVFTTGQVAKICKVAPRTVSKW